MPEPQFPVGINRVSLGNMAETQVPRRRIKLVFSLKSLDYFDFQTSCQTGDGSQRARVREQTRSLRDTNSVYSRNQGRPNCREAHGHGVSIVVSEGERPLQGKGRQV
jgi:hypothetical protein